jgi:hypothetical protein
VGIGARVAEGTGKIKELSLSRRRIVNHGSFLLREIGTGGLVIFKRKF